MAIGPAPYGAWLGWKPSSPPALPCAGRGRSTSWVSQQGLGVRPPPPWPHQQLFLVAAWSVRLVPRDWRGM